MEKAMKSEREAIHLTDGYPAKIYEDDDGWHVAHATVHGERVTVGYMTRALAIADADRAYRAEWERED